MQRDARMTGIVEFVASGSRLRVLVPKHTCVISVVLAGLSCPKIGRDGAPDQPYAQEALEFTKKFCLQVSHRLVGTVFVEHFGEARGNSFHPNPSVTWPHFPLSNFIIKIFLSQTFLFSYL